MSDCIDKKLAGLLEMIETGKIPDSSLILSMLRTESVSSRCENNVLLALAFFAEGTTAGMEKARILIQRAWDLSGGAEELLHIYIAVHASLKDTESIRNAYKRTGMIAASKNDIEKAISNFNLWQNAYAAYDKVDRYSVDYDILDAMRRLAEPLRVENYKRPLADSSPVRVGYLINGLTSVGSVLIKINSLFAEFHDRKRFHIVFYSPEAASNVENSVVAKEFIQLIKSYGWDLVTAPECANRREALPALARRIAADRTDILVTVAGLADFEHYFLALLRPAPILIGCIYSSIAQYVTSIFDWGITASPHTLQDAPMNCSVIPLEFLLPQKEQNVRRDEVFPDVPSSSVVMMVLGRWSKFQNIEFIRVLTRILAENENSVLVFAGGNAEHVPLDKIEFSETLMSRMKFIPWTGDYLKYLRLSDIVLDTYPYGGGVVLLEAMALEIPIVTFEDDNMAIFDQMNWSAASDLLLMGRLPELVAPRGDFDAFKKIADRLVRDTCFRKHMAVECKEIAEANYSMPARMVRRYEDIYSSVFAMKRNNELDDCSGAYIESRCSEKLNAFKSENLTAGSFRAYALLSEIVEASNFDSAVNPVIALGNLVTDSPLMASKLAGRIESLPMEDIRTRLLLFYFYQSSGNLKALIGIVGILIARKCIFPSLFYWKGIALRREGQVEEAMGAFISEIEFFPKDYSAIPASIEAGALSKEIPGMTGKMQDVIDKAQIDDVLRWNLLFNFYQSSGDLKTSTDLADILIARKCIFPNLFYWRGIALRKQSLLEEAAKCFDEERRIYGENGFILLQEAILLKCQNRLSDAKALLMQALSSYPDTEWLRCEMGLVYEKEGDCGGALKYFLMEDNLFPRKKHVLENIRRVESQTRSSLAK